MTGSSCMATSADRREREGVRGGREWWPRRSDWPRELLLQSVEEDCGVGVCRNGERRSQIGQKGAS